MASHLPVHSSLKSELNVQISNTYGLRMKEKQTLWSKWKLYVLKYILSPIKIIDNPLHKNKNITIVSILFACKQ